MQDNGRFHALQQYGLIALNNLVGVVQGHQVRQKPKVPAPASLMLELLRHLAFDLVGSILLARTLVRLA
jgi:hypothetical protein